MRWILSYAALLTLVLAACGGKPKYPLCKGDKDCREGEHCVNQRCQQCGTDEHCAEGQTCEEGACVNVGPTTTVDTDDGLTPCSVDEDCADDEDCIEGKCRQPWNNEGPEGLTCVLETVTFEFDAATVPESARDSLGRSADCIKQAPDERGVLLEGHTDPRGTEEYNIALSERRARSVADYLASLGIDPVRFQIIPKGEAEASGIDESTWQLDRKVELDWR